MTESDALKLARDALAAVAGSTVRPSSPSDGAALDAVRSAIAAIDALARQQGDVAGADHQNGQFVLS